MNPIEISRVAAFRTVAKYLLKGKSNAPSAQQTLIEITNQKSVFTRQDIARHLNKDVDDAGSMSHALDKVLAADELVMMQSKEEGDDTLYYSTWEMVALERDMIEASKRLAGNQSHGVFMDNVDSALKAANDKIHSVAGVHLSDEQINAVRHITGREQLTVVSGLAGAGKSTMLEAARGAWEAQGYEVYGAALSGKAAEGLQESSGIVSRTLASYEMGWKNGYGELSENDVFVIDEAGMSGSKQLSRFIKEVERAGAKIVLVGDSEQLQAINAGAPFRQTVEQIGAAKLENVIRQREVWQQEATKDFSHNRTAEGLAAYEQHGYLRFRDNQEDTLESLVDDYLADMAKHPQATRMALAHRRVDVKAIRGNEKVHVKIGHLLREDFGSS